MKTKEKILEYVEKKPVGTAEEITRDWVWIMRPFLSTWVDFAHTFP